MVELDIGGREFCVVCGRTDRKIVDGECSDCYARYHVLVDTVDHPTIILCPTCGARRVGRHWERSGSSTLLGSEDLAPFLRPHPEVAVRRVEWHETGSNPFVRELGGDVAIRFRGTERVVPVRFSAHIEHRACLECSRRSGRYYTAVIQLRGTESSGHEPARALRARLERAWERALAETRGDGRNALSFREELPEGWDYFLNDTPTARALARWMKTRFRAQLKESATLWGRKDGRDAYRVTFCVRIPADAPPEVLSPHEQPRWSKSARAAARLEP